MRSLSEIVGQPWSPLLLYFRSVVVPSGSGCGLALNAAAQTSARPRAAADMAALLLFFLLLQLLIDFIVIF